ARLAAIPLGLAVARSRAAAATTVGLLQVLDEGIDVIGDLLAAGTHLLDELVHVPLRFLGSFPAGLGLDAVEVLLDLDHVPPDLADQLRELARIELFLLLRLLGEEE